MNLGWKPIVIASIAIAALGLTGYAVYSQKQEGKKQHAKGEKSKTASNENVSASSAKSAPTKTKKKRPVAVKEEKKDSVAANETQKNGIVKEEKTVAEPLRVNTLPLSDAGAQDMQKLMDDCDLPASKLNEFDPAYKERIFYTLLMKGPDGIKAAVGYFAKAVGLIAAPGEVLFALEKTLPPPVFELLLQEIQSDIQGKVRGYFDSIFPKSAPVYIKEDTMMDAEFKEMRPVFVPVAKQDIAMGTTLWEEVPDISTLTIGAYTPDACEHCFKILADDGKVACPACDAKLYCSEACCSKSGEIYHCYICKAPKEVAAAYDELLTLCRSNKSSLALLILRYISLLLSEELRGNGSANNGPFSHYDHLHPVMKAPSDVDRAEAKLLKRILSPANANVAQFLTDEIYSAMKATLARNVIIHAPASNENLSTPDLNQAECRINDVEGRLMSFFHNSAHLTHSCDPNVAMVNVNKTGTISMAALKPIMTGSPLTISYLPFPSGTTKDERQERLMKLFGVECQCQLCADGVDSP